MIANIARIIDEISVRLSQIPHVLRDLAVLDYLINSVSFAYNTNIFFRVHFFHYLLKQR